MVKKKEKRSPTRPTGNSATGTASHGFPTAKKSKKSRKASGHNNYEKIKGVVRSLVKVIAFVIILFLVLAYSPGLLDIEPVPLEVQQPRPFIGILEPNDILKDVQKLFHHQIVGPESIAFYKGDLYTGLHSGWIVRIKDDKTIEPIVTMGDPKCEPWEEERCGRPLGLRFDSNGALHFLDSYSGLFKVNVNSGAVTTLYRSSEAMNGKVSRFLNDLDISASGDIYFTDTSNKFPLNLGIYEILETAPNGRVLHYDVKTNTTRLLFDGIAFANGIQLSPKEDYLLVCETNRQRILKHHLTGNRKGETDVFVDNLPGSPDNLRSNGKGGYWLPLIIVFPPSRRNILGKLRPYPIVRKVLARLIHVLRVSLKFIDTFYSTAFTKTVIYKLPHLTTYTSLMPSYGLILELDGDGHIVRSLHASDVSLIGYVSEVHQHGQHLYLGSPWNRFLGKLIL